MTRTGRLEWETDVSTSPSAGARACAVARCQRNASTTVALALGGRERAVRMCTEHAGSWSSASPYPSPRHGAP